LTNSTKKTVLVTGVTSGIGLEATRKFLSLGYRVAGCARRKNRLNEIEKEFGADFAGVSADLTKEGAVDHVFAEVRERFGPVDVLINNAGVGYETSIMEGDPLQWKAMLDLNVYALALCCRQALDDMRVKDKGYIFNVSSMSAHRVTQGGGVYAATKYAVRALTEGLRQELCAKKSGIRVTAISPGFVETEFYNSYYHNLDDTDKAAVFDDLIALQTSDVVDAIIYSLNTPNHVGINDILMRPLEQMS
jgi:NADP-dependent 3-hydroxy acid dehydrogenase YdfG